MLAKQPLTQEARLKIGRIAVVAMALMATVLAMKPDSKVLDVVSYAWAGLGASLGPSILLSLYWRSMTAAGALAGVVTGGATVIIWESVSGGLFELYSLVPGFVLSLIAIAAVSWISVKPNAVVQKQFDQMRSQL
jgi:sodium/proline symporter